MKRRNFIAAGIAGTLSSNVLLTKAFAQPTSDQPRAKTNKVKKKSLSPVHVKPDKNPSFKSGAKIRFEQTNNQLSTWERIVLPKTMGPAPHIHKELDEIMRVLKGKVTVMVGEDILEVEEGGWHLRPRGFVHTFWNASDEPAHVLEIYPNQNFEVFLEELNRLIGGFIRNGISPGSSEARQQIDDLEQEWGVVSFHSQREELMKKYGLT